MNHRRRRPPSRATGAATGAATALRRAFTLAEVVVALAVFALTGGVLLQTVLNVQEALIGARHEAGRDEARRSALRIALAATSSDNLLAGGSMSLEGGNGSVSWTATLEETNLPDLHRVIIEISWDDDDGGDDGETETLNLWLYRPEWSDADTRSNLMQNFRADYPQSRLSSF
ncbi:MAG: type II secretion system GspH family protein [Puniceicoccales bacterium]|jgi:prepilin-type N-terminal cleavage/methylation domain-containing protein|nr:type II secretion system GspH family protein [Puniceicoccales bacterium]